MQTIRIGILGAGAMGAEHAWCYGQIEGVTVAGVFSRDVSRAAAVADPSNALAVSNAAELIGEPSIDAIDVCLPTPAHAPFVIAALEAGKHVFCETPLALDPGEGRRMRDAARAAGKLLQVGLLMRSISPCLAVKAWAESGEHGRLLSLTAHRFGSYLRADAPDHKAHYSDPTTELMTFDLDFIGWVMGRPARVSAAGSTWNGALGEATALLAYDDGRSAIVLASGVAPASFPFTTGFRAVFERALFETETIIAGGEVRASSRLFLENREATPDLPATNPYQAELERFIACIRGAADPALLDADRALEAFELSLAVQRSLEEKRTIQV